MVAAEDRRPAAACPASRRLSSPNLNIELETTCRALSASHAPNGADFLRGAIATFPYAIHTVLTDNGMVFADFSPQRFQ